MNWLLLTGVGLFTGVLAGFLGIGGGIVLVPLLVQLGNRPVEAVATSSLAIIVTSLSGSFQNWRSGQLRLERAFYLALPALVAAQGGVLAARNLGDRALLVAFGFFLVANVFLLQWRKHVTKQASADELPNATWNPALGRLVTGGIAGFMAGLFGVGGGVILVPLQILLLGEPIKRAIQTSLAAIVMTAASSTVGHAAAGNVLWVTGLILGTGGLVGAQVSTRVLPKLSDRVVSTAFTTLLLLETVYIFWQAWSHGT